jgi:hypothetical protein
MHSRRDPLTGDILPPVERFSLLVQGILRKWRFIIGYSVLTGVWWYRPTWFGDNHNYVHWQLGASFFAVLIESIVGIGMFGWARRDSVILRKVHALERKAEQQDENDHVILHEILRIATETSAQTRLLREVYRAAQAEVGEQETERARQIAHDTAETLHHAAEEAAIIELLSAEDEEEAP